MTETTERSPGSPDPLQIRDIKAKDADAEELVRHHMMLAMAGGLIPIPLLDIAAITSVQLDMLKRLAENYEVEFDSGSSRAFVTSLVSALGVSTAARFGASAVKLLPGIGTLAGGLAQAGLTGANTYAVGMLFKRLFREGQSIEALTPDMVREEAESYLQAGIKYARELSEQGLFRRGEK
ncbi:MAG: DUF697 domain-containing protein [Myxococcota bacterium]